MLVRFVFIFIVVDMDLHILLCLSGKGLAQTIKMGVENRETLRRLAGDIDMQDTTFKPQGNLCLRQDGVAYGDIDSSLADAGSRD